MFETICSKSRVTWSGTTSFSTGRSARSASIASRAWSRSRSSSPSRRYPSEETVKTAWTRTSETLSFFSSPSSCASSSASLGCCASSSATDHVARLDLLGVDVLQRPALLDARDLPLGGVRRRHRELKPELVSDHCDPLRHPLELGPRGPDIEHAGIEQAAREPVADRAPHVLLDQPRRRVRQRLALVDGARDPGGEPVDERREVTRLAEVGLRVADAHLDGRVREVRPHAPPDLRVLVD